MSDSKVLMAQQWLNQTYGGRTGYGSNIAEDGLTGWETINAMIRALQIELGITSTANNFGPSTISKFNNRFPSGIQEQNCDDQTEDNIYGIIQCACWCKGYSANYNGITKHFYSETGNSIKELKNHAGCSDTNSTVTINVMKALLSMDQFVLVVGGSTTIQQIQRILNNKYESYIGLSPCDGLYGRTMNDSLIKVLQAIEGYSETEATGNFGSGTKSKLPIVPSLGEISEVTETRAIELIRFALCCNGYSVSIETSGWDATLQNIIKEFQSDMCIEQTGKCDANTWMALLLSKGNPDRSCVACDTRFELTNEVLQYLKNNGYELVGRYLTGGDFKELRIDEPKRILDAGLKLVPIFQESSTEITYFSPSQGKSDAKNAVTAARKHGIQGGNIIYFAVDMDPVETQITNYILPYFEAIFNNISKSFKVGVYGTRNVCTRVMNAGFAETCYVSDSSTGFSGNMGFKMPSNWNFDQFVEVKNLQIGQKLIDLDKVAYSGKFPAVEKIYSSIFQYNAYIQTLESYYVDYKASTSGSCNVEELILGVTNFLRSFKYAGEKWYAATLRSIDTTFIDYVKNRNISLYNNLKEYADTDEVALKDLSGGYIDIGHLAATIEGYYTSNLAPDFWFGWGGDLSTLMADVDKAFAQNGNTKTHLEIAKSILGNGSSFGYADLCTDADAIKIAQILKSSTSNKPVSSAIAEYYLNHVQYRYSYYLYDLNNVSLNLSDLKNAIINKMGGIEETILLILLAKSPSREAMDASCEAFAQYIIDNYSTI
jgi:peptidoglycan hydrolase-like protein with peptidoglycan-binding domain